MTELEIRSLGRLELLLGGAPLDGLRAEKARALVCFLAVSGQAHNRAELAGMFWSDLSEEDARNNLRVTLLKLRQLLPEQLLATRKAISLNFDSPYKLDVEMFWGHIRNEPELGGATHLQEAANLYRGDFLEGFYLAGAQLFDEWMATQREQLRHTVLQALQTLAERAMEQRDYTSSINNLTRLLALDAWREEGYRQLMLAYAYQGQREAALTQYQTCCRVLAEELGLEPAEETTRLYEQVRSGQVGLRQDPTPTPLSRHVAERRHVTVLNVELLIDPLLDPEDLSDHVATFREACVMLVERYGGFSLDPQGTTHTAYFGFPQAHEDDPRRATLAALDLLSRVNTMRPALRIRQAVHSGAVVVTSQDETVDVVGLPLLIAQRLCSAGHAGDILLSGVTEGLLRGYFVLGAQELYRLESLTEPFTAYRVKGETAARSRLEVAPPKAPMVGRQAERAVLKQVYGEVIAGTGQAVLVLGDAGIGKSRLLFDFRNELRDAPHSWAEIQGVSYHASTPYYPVINWLEHEIGFQSEDEADARLESLQAYVLTLGLPIGEMVPPLSFLLSLPNTSNLTLSPERWRHEILEALACLFLTKAAQRPLVLAFEDLHWYDPSTLEVLQLLSKRLAMSQVMLLLTSRSEPDWDKEPPGKLTRLSLESLGKDETLELVDLLGLGLDLAWGVRQHLAALSDGVPLYIEELLRSVPEADSLNQERFDTLGVPFTLQDAMTARLDQSSDAMEVAQFASVLGKTFSFELITATSPFSNVALRHSLDRLVMTGLVSFDKNQNIYMFKHALVQEAAYATLLKRQRQDFHARIARTLEREGYPSVSPELLAHHFSGAALHDEALQAWQWACERAFKRSAYPEAIQHLKNALGILSLLPEAPTRDELELSLTLKLAGALHVTKGYASPEVKEAYDRAQELCVSADLHYHLFPILLGQAGYHCMRAEFAAAKTLLQQMFALPPSVLAPQQLGELHFMAGRVHAFQGKLDRAQEHLAAVLTQKNDAEVPLPVLSDITSLTEIQVTALGQSATVSWLAGYPDRALDFARRTVFHEKSSINLHRQASALSFKQFTHFVRGELTEAEKLSVRFMRLVSEQIMTSWRAPGKIWQGAFAVAAGQAEGLSLIREGLTLFDAQGTVTQRPFLLCLYASALKQLGQQEQANDVIDSALIQCKETGERWWEAEVLRLKGKSLQRAGNLTEAVSYFYQSVAVAQLQQARSLELRAWCSLVQVHRAIGETSDAELKLTELLNGFTEGFETHDLQRARTLIVGD